MKGLLLVLLFVLFLTVKAQNSSKLLVESEFAVPSVSFIFCNNRHVGVDGACGFCFI